MQTLNIQKANTSERKICILGLILYSLGPFISMPIKIINHREYLLPCILMAISAILYICVISRIKGDNDVLRNRELIIYSGALKMLYIFGCVFESKLYIKEALDTPDTPLLLLALGLIPIFQIVEVIIFMKNKVSSILKYFVVFVFVIVFYFGMINISSFWIFMLAIPLLIACSQFQNMKLIVSFSAIIDILVIFGVCRQIYYFETSNISIVSTDIMKIIQVLMMPSDDKNIQNIKSSYAVLALFVILFTFITVMVTATLKKNNEAKLELVIAEQKRLENLTKKVIEIGSAVKTSANSTNELLAELDGAIVESGKLISQIQVDNTKNIKGIEEQKEISSGIATIINDVVADVAGAKKVTDASLKTLEKSKRTFNNLKNQSNKIYNNNKEVINVIKEFVNNVNEVKNITSGITEISEETNLLSLNASIESAKALDSGKGFAVIADEIRKLADETNTLTDNIDEIIISLEESAYTTQNVINEVVEDINYENNIIDETMNDFETMDLDMQRLGNNVDIISNSVDNVNNYKNEIENHIIQLMDSSELVTEHTVDVSNLNAINMENTKSTKDLMEKILSSADKLDEYSNK